MDPSNIQQKQALMEITVKTSFKDLTLGTFNTIQSIVGGETWFLDTEVELAALLTDLTTDQVRELPLPVFKEVIRKATFLKDLPKGKIKETYKLGEYTYLPELQIKDWTSGRFIDFMELTKREDDISLFIACVLTPKGMKYNERNLLDVQQDVLNHMSVEDAMGIVNFFLNLSNAFLQTTQDYLKQKSQTMNPSKASLKDGNGSL
jgi:hypothetical protein